VGERFDDIDFKITEDGDLILSSDNDLEVVTSIDYVKQCVTSRLRSVTSDWYYDHIGADLEGFIGNPNTKENALEMKLNIINALTIDKFCDMDDIVIYITPTPNMILVIGLYIATTFQEDPIQFIIEFSFLTGFKIIS